MNVLLNRPGMHLAHAGADRHTPLRTTSIRPGMRVLPRPSPLRAVAEAPADGAPSAAVKPAPAAAKKANVTPHWQLVKAELAKTKEEGRKCMVIQVAPAVRVAISEAYGLPPGAYSAKKIAAGLRRIGFDYVFDTLFGADITIMEEGTELLHRLTAHLEGNPEEPMPMFTSCCPGWIFMAEKSYPELLPYLSSCKSPQMMQGAVIKGFFANEAGINPGDIVSCSVMPCVRKQGEADRPWVNTAEGHDVDHVITTVEMAQLFQEYGIDFPNLPEEEFDGLMGGGSGGGQLFGTTGGVMEAALRTVVEIVSGNPMGKIFYDEVRGMDGIKAATVHMVPKPDSPFAKFDKDGKGLDIRIAVANGLGNAKKLIAEMKAGTAKYDFIEIMACPSGCIGGGGQPRSTDKQILQKRQQAMYNLDERMVMRRPDENPLVQAVYNKWLGNPCSHLAHEKLHTHYMAGGPECAE